MKKIVYVLFAGFALLNFVITTSSCTQGGGSDCNVTPNNNGTNNGPILDSISLGSFIAYTDLARDVWAPDSLINGYYTRIYQDDIGMPDFKDLFITMTVDGQTYIIYKQGSTSKTKVKGCIVDWSVAIDEDNFTTVGFDINWYNPGGSEWPKYPVNPYFEVTLILYGSGYKMSVPVTVKRSFFMTNVKVTVPRKAHTNTSPYKTE